MDSKRTGKAEKEIMKIQNEISFTLNKKRINEIHDVLIEELKPLMKECSISGEHAGVHLLLTFKNGRTEEELISLAKDQGIRVYGLSDYCIKNSAGDKATILLGYANLSEQQIRDAVHILIDCWK